MSFTEKGLSERFFVDALAGGDFAERDHDRGAAVDHLREPLFRRRVFVRNEAEADANTFLYLFQLLPQVVDVRVGGVNVTDQPVNSLVCGGAHGPPFITPSAQ